MASAFHARRSISQVLGVGYCELATTDGDKACATSAQCQSECVEHPGGNRCAGTVSGCFEKTGRGTVTQCVN
jgi:hypothetical protein